MNPTIAVQLTGPGTGAIAVMLLTGDRAADILRQIARSPRLAQLQPGNALHATLHHPTSHEKIDDAMVIQTAATAYELHIHGGVAVAAAVLASLKSAGATIINIAEAHRRGIFGAGITGELTLALPLAKTLTAARLLAAQLDAGLSVWVRHWQSWLADKSANDLWRLHSVAQWLLHRSQTLAHLLNPPRIAIIGPPNAGKSTLANALLGRPVSITSDIPGTTRDWVDAHATFIAAGGGDIHIPVTLIDTAGVRETADVIEQESIARTHHQAHAADAIILLFDASRPSTSEDRALLNAYTGRRVPLIIAANKTDLPHPHLPAPTAIPLSAKTHTGLDNLMTAVLQQLDLAEISPTEPFAFTPRQREILQNLALSADIQSAQELLSFFHNA